MVLESVPPRTCICSPKKPVSGSTVIYGIFILQRCKLLQGTVPVLSLLATGRYPNKIKSLQVPLLNPTKSFILVLETARPWAGGATQINTTGVKRTVDPGVIPEKYQTIGKYLLARYWYSIFVS